MRRSSFELGANHLADAEAARLGEVIAEKLIEHIRPLEGVDKITPAGSLRRGRETVGDLDILVTGCACENDEQRQAVIGDYTH